MDNSFTFYSFIAVLCCLLAGGFFAWLLYGRSSAMAQSLRVTLAIFRAVTVSLILWLLCAPLIRQISYTLEKPIIVIAQDNSQSIAAFSSPGLDTLQYRKAVEELRDQLSQQYEVRAYSFSDHVAKGLYFGYTGRLTNAALLVSQLKDELMNRNVGAVILASDGIFNRGGNPAEDIAELKAPVYTIALGDTTAQKDVLIANINSNDLVYLDNDFRIEVQAEAWQCAGAETRLTVTENGTKLHEEVLKLNSGQFLKTIPITLKASSLGTHRYTVSLASVKGEISLKNNVQRVIVEVIDDRQKVLIAAAGPHPDLAALKEAIALNKHYDVSLQTGEQLAHTDPATFGLIVLYQLPSLSYDARGFLEKVRALKVPLWYIVGAQSNLSQFSQSQAGVSIAAGSRALLYAYSDINTANSVFDLDAASRKVIENFDPLQVSSGELKTFGDFQAVINQRRGKISTGLPQLFFMNVNGRKTGYLIGEGLWKWKFSEAKDNQLVPVFSSLMGKIVQYLSVRDDKRKFVVHAAKQTFDENEHVLINASLYNDSYVPVNSADVTIQLRNDAGKTYNFSFSKFESAYQLDAGILPPGNYSYVAGTALGTQKYTAKGSFYINALIAEFQQTVANHQLLYQLSNQTNGKLYLPQQIPALQKDLMSSKEMKTLSYEDRRYEELINFKSLLVLILLLLSTEWFLRKRNGAI
ncbi:hypothetical protein SAMN06265348_105185 [Pedobacter westerhofensis]|uniref:VWA domain-containing protein n=1 Tax=Pedobacter westerhofensis TaxID=425512 RepID=A0A521DDF1_9SPHI|nr:VWA domain-containing protein [Pedobacter westerhofensis]SMO69171.1 hypothetical protein SAMN06265348_105185 [Pedobacter westerhofensis]